MEEKGINRMEAESDSNTKVGIIVRKKYCSEDKF